MLAIQIAIAAACAVVLLETAVFFAHFSRLRRLDRSAAPEPREWPRVSVIVAARDEARDIAATVATRLADDYPALELILVDDRSGDGTGRLAAEAAAGDPRFALVRVDDLPAGWLGKVHAMRRGAERATGEWLLFSDGDISVAPGTLRRAIAHCAAERLDMLALVPALEPGSVLVDSIWTVFLRAVMVLVDPGAVRDPRRKAAMGSGGFNLVRREALARTAGLEDLRLETGDDVALAVMVKRAGGRVDLADGSRLVSVPMYRNVGQFLRGIEKNGSSAAHIPLPIFAAANLLLWALVFAPLAGVALGPGWLRLLGAATFSLYTAGEVTGLVRNARRWPGALLWPIGGAVMSFGLVRAAYLAKKNRGVTWRGTFYSLDALRAGRRL
jgi:glycosyltransferase involved in cell wall biosynthesis